MHKYSLSLCFAIFLVSVLILPNSNYDPISIPKFVILVISSCLGFAYIQRELKLSAKNWFFGNRFSKLITLMLSLVLLNLFVNHYSFAERLYGVSGRNMGFLTYFSLGLLALQITRVRTEIFLQKYLRAMLLCNLVVAAYFLVQFIGWDPFAFQEYYSAPSSTLGNPNFVSSFIAFTFISLWVPFWKSKNLLNLIIGFLGTSLNLFVIWKSDSIQGFIILIICVILTLLSLIFIKSFKIATLLGLLMLPVAIIVFIGMIGRGPFGGLLSVQTIIQRYYYWRASLRMGIDSPFVGKGLDSFGDFYRQFRDSTAFSSSGGQVADSAHNFLFDLFAAGGIPLAMVALLIFSIPSLYLIQRIVNSKKLDPQNIVLVWIWAGFIAQSLISPGQIGLMVWGWSCMGLIMGLKESTENLKYKPVTTPRFLGIFSTIVLFACSCIVILPLVADARFLSALKSQEPAKVFNAVTSWPSDTKRLIVASYVYNNSGLPNFSIEVSRFGVKWNPNSFELWRDLYSNRLVRKDEKRRVLVEILRLEPRFNQTDG
jgi:O-antigen ligase